MSKIIRCYAEGRANRWEAVCLDFDLAVQGSSFDQVYHDLNEAVVMYLESVAELPVADQRRLLNRRAPLWLQIRFALRLGWALFSGRDGNGRDGSSRGGFTLPCPA